MASNSKELLSALKVSLPKIEATTEPIRTVHRFPVSTPPPARESKVAPKGVRAPKLSVSLYQHDIERLDTIKDFMKAQGFRNLSDSEALRLACRKVEINGALIEVYKTMQGEDGRRKQE
jgi:hypothetical protein